MPLDDDEAKRHAKEYFKFIENMNSDYEEQKALQEKMNNPENNFKVINKTFISMKFNIQPSKAIILAAIIEHLDNADSKQMQKLLKVIGAVEVK